MDEQIGSKTGLVIQARMKSERLPGKVLLPLPFTNGEPLLGRIIDALNQIEGKTIVATSVNRENDDICNFCLKKGIACFRGEEDNVFSRFLEVQNLYSFSNIVRLTADNPFIDSTIIKRVLDYHIANEFDYTSTTGLPIGMNVEVFSGAALLKCNDYIRDNRDNEHVTLIFKREDAFRKGLYVVRQNVEKIRLTVDTAADYLLANFISQVQQETKLEGVELINFILDRYIWVFEGNREILQKNSSKKLEDEIAEAISVLNKLHFFKSASILSIKSGTS